MIKEGQRYLPDDYRIFQAEAELYQYRIRPRQPMIEVIAWRRQVSPPPGTPTFGDVPPSDAAFPFIEALVASGITAGCGSGNYCPDNPITRRQMAVFLAKALGLHWPN